jgi:hypothetical protein
VRIGVSGNGSLTVRDGGRIICSPTLFAQTNGEVKGNGFVQATLANSGSVRPGLSPGILNVEGNYIQNPSGKLFIEIGGLTPGSQHDQLSVTGAATLGGELIVSFISGFVPSSGNQFSILTAGSRSGTFATTTLPPLPPGLLWSVLYDTTGVRLRVGAPCPADIAPSGGGDAIVNSADLLAVINSWGACPAPPAACISDISPAGGDGVVNVADLLAIINAWGACP